MNYHIVFLNNQKPFFNKAIEVILILDQAICLIITHIDIGNQLEVFKKLVNTLLRIMTDLEILSIQDSQILPTINL